MIKPILSFWYFLFYKFLCCFQVYKMQLESKHAIGKKNMQGDTSYLSGGRDVSPKLGFRLGSLVRIEPLKSKVCLQVIVLLLHHVKIIMPSNKIFRIATNWDALNALSIFWTKNSIHQCFIPLSRDRVNQFIHLC